MTTDQQQAAMPWTSVEEDSSKQSGSWSRLCDDAAAAATPSESPAWSRLPPTPDSQMVSPSAVHEDVQQMEQLGGAHEQRQPEKPGMKRSTTIRFDPKLEPPPLRERSLSRSKTLTRLQETARQDAQKMNYYHGFNHHNWFLSIRWIFKGTGKNVFVPLGVFVGFAVLVVVFVESLGLETRLDLGTDVTTGLGSSMALLIAFRLNVCFSRWWEGRILWGRVIESARSLVTIALSLEGDAEPMSSEAARHRANAEGLAGWNIAFAVALKYHLRETKFECDEHLTSSIERLLCGKGLAFGSSAIQRLKASRHPPLHALRSIRHAIRRVICMQREAGAEITGLENLFNQLSGELHGALTGCERILRTPCPPGYVGVLRLSLVFFLLLLPFVLLEIGYWLIPVQFCTSFVLLGAEEVAIQLEQPFGDDQNDLPLDSYCYTLEADLVTLLDEKLEAE